MKALFVLAALMLCGCSPPTTNSLLCETEGGPMREVAQGQTSYPMLMRSGAWSLDGGKYYMQQPGEVCFVASEAAP